MPTTTQQYLSRAPDFLLPDVQGQLVSLSSLVAQGKVVLAFYRGVWCPYCNMQLRNLQQALPQIRAEGASLVAISPQLPDYSLSTVEKNSLEFPVLSDVGNHIAIAFGVCFALSPELKARNPHLEDINGRAGASALPHPSVFIISSDLTILFAESQIDYTRRMDPEAILAELKRTSS